MKPYYSIEESPRGGVSAVVFWVAYIVLVVVLIIMAMRAF
jgi:hypothetical protein